MRTPTKAWLTSFKTLFDEYTNSHTIIDQMMLEKYATRYYGAGMNNKQAALAAADYFRLTYYRENYISQIKSSADPLIEEIPTDINDAINLLHTLNQRAEDLMFLIDKINERVAADAATRDRDIPVNSDDLRSFTKQINKDIETARDHAPDKLEKCAATTHFDTTFKKFICNILLAITGEKTCEQILSEMKKCLVAAEIHLSAHGKYPSPHHILSLISFGWSEEDDDRWETYDLGRPLDDIYEFLTTNLQVIVATVLAGGNEKGKQKAKISVEKRFVASFKQFINRDKTITS
jgi:hypothetical protein